MMKIWISTGASPCAVCMLRRGFMGFLWMLQLYPTVQNDQTYEYHCLIIITHVNLTTFATFYCIQWQCCMCLKISLHQIKKTLKTFKQVTAIFWVCFVCHSGFMFYSNCVCFLMIKEEHLSYHYIYIIYLGNMWISMGIVEKMYRKLAIKRQ